MEYWSRGRRRTEERRDLIASSQARKQIKKVIMGTGDHPHGFDLPQHPTFQGVANYPPPPPVIGFPKPVPPPGSADPAPPSPPPPHPPGYQTVPGYAVTEGRPERKRRLPCCGLGCGWLLFISGFFLAGIPWLVAAICLLCNRDRMGDREKPGYVASVIAGVAIIAIVLGVTKGTHAW